MSILLDNVLSNQNIQLEKELEILRKRFPDERIKKNILGSLPWEEVRDVARNFLSIWGCPNLATKEGEEFLIKKFL